jgi:deferrochelatase/peroxidase EfeB
MKKHSFTLGVIAGATSIAIAVPMIVQVANAANTDIKNNPSKVRPAPTQACVQLMATHKTNMLSYHDEMTTARKTAITAHRDALVVAAALTVNADRLEALKKARDNFQAAMKAVKEAHKLSDAEIAAMKTACGYSLHGKENMKFGEMHGKRRSGKGMKHFMRHGGDHHDTDQ